MTTTTLSRTIKDMMSERKDKPSAASAASDEETDVQKKTSERSSRMSNKKLPPVVVDEEERSSPTAASSATAMIEYPTDNDVLLGRGAACWNHVGNRKFREIVSKYLDAYENAKLRIEKTMIVSDILSQVEDSGGRFLKKKAPERKRAKDDIWTEVDRKAAIEKVGHAIRDRKAMEQKKEQQQQQMVAAARGGSSSIVDDDQMQQRTSMGAALSAQEAAYRHQQPSLPDQHSTKADTRDALESALQIASRSPSFLSQGPPGGRVVMPRLELGGRDGGLMLAQSQQPQLGLSAPSMTPTSLRTLPAGSPASFLGRPPGSMSLATPSHANSHNSNQNMQSLQHLQQQLQQQNHPQQGQLPNNPTLNSGGPTGPTPSSLIRRMMMLDSLNQSQPQSQHPSPQQNPPNLIGRSQNSATLAAEDAVLAAAQQQLLHRSRLLEELRNTTEALQTLQHTHNVISGLQDESRRLQSYLPQSQQPNTSQLTANAISQGMSALRGSEQQNQQRLLALASLSTMLDSRQRQQQQQPPPNRRGSVDTNVDPRDQQRQQFPRQRRNHSM